MRIVKRLSRDGRATWRLAWVADHWQNPLNTRTISDPVGKNCHLWDTCGLEDLAQEGLRKARRASRTESMERCAITGSPAWPPPGRADRDDAATLAVAVSATGREEKSLADVGNCTCALR